MAHSKLIDPIAKAELSKDIKTGKLLAEKGRGKQLYLYTADYESPVLLELGRLREETFRAVGLGSGKSCDIDEYDFSYEQLILWDDDKQAIIGGYRLMECRKAQENNIALYTQSIYQYSDEFIDEYFDHTVEMGRVFVQKSYWGTRSLDYLWYGMAYYFAEKPNHHYFVCALSIPTAFSPYARQLMVEFYSRLFPSEKQLATSLFPYKSSNIDTGNFFNKLTDIIGQKARFKFLRKYLEEMGFNFPMLYKNTDIFHKDGVKFISFGYDQGFSNALDGLMLADTRRIRSLTRNRYTSEVDKATSTDTPQKDTALEEAL
ncbi:MAG: GNAT family N-acetyltransferase [Pseudomonadales bacterium]|nr:GNAT family N-acetyltransferase [Pseudomonadales bacterium]